MKNHKALGGILLFPASREQKRERDGVAAAADGKSYSSWR